MLTSKSLFLNADARYINPNEPSGLIAPNLLSKICGLYINKNFGSIFECIFFINN